MKVIAESNILYNFNKFCENLGMKINKRKTKYMILVRKSEEINISSGNKVLQQVDNLAAVDNYN